MLEPWEAQNLINELRLAIADCETARGEVIEKTEAGTFEASRIDKCGEYPAVNPPETDRSKTGNA